MSLLVESRDFVGEIVAVSLSDLKWNNPLNASSHWVCSLQSDRGAAIILGSREPEPVTGSMFYLHRDPTLFPRSCDHSGRADRQCSLRRMRRARSPCPRWRGTRKERQSLDRVTCPGRTGGRQAGSTRRVIPRLVLSKGLCCRRCWTDGLCGPRQA